MDVLQIAVPLKYVKICKNIKIPSIKILLFNCETNLTLTWLENCVIYVADRTTTFTVVTLSAHRGNSIITSR